MPVELRPYQVDIARRGVDILRRHGILYLAMEVRTGKTLTALQIAYNVGAKSVLFCTRVKAMFSIQLDYEKAEYPFELDIINYESLHKITKAQEASFDLVICDEAHSLGAFPKPSERARMVRRLVGHKYLILLSGTPTPESYSQLFHQFWVSWNSPFPEASFYSWAKQYVRVQSRYFYNREVKDYKDADRDAVMEKCEHLFIKFSQEDAGFAEQVDEQIITVRMNDSTRTGIERLKKNRVLTTKEGTVIADTAVKLMSKLHQLHSGTVIVDQPIGPHDHYAFDMSKANAIKDLFTGKKIAIFYKFQAELGILQWVFAGRIVETPEQFNATGPDKVYLTQIQSGREGINLSAADALVMYNIDFSAVSYWQARARLQSKDRETPAMVYWIFSEDGIEFKIYEAVKAKKNYTLAYFVKDFGINDK
jgi:hypothetical protein